MSGGEIYKLQRLLGHSSIQMTERYSHLSPDHLNGATEILDFGTRRKCAEVIELLRQVVGGQVDKKLTKNLRKVDYERENSGLKEKSGETGSWNFCFVSIEICSNYLESFY